MTRCVASAAPVWLINTKPHLRGTKPKSINYAGFILILIPVVWAKLDLRNLSAALPLALSVMLPAVPVITSAVAEPPGYPASSLVPQTYTSTLVDADAVIVPTAIVQLATISTILAVVLEVTSED